MCRLFVSLYEMSFLFSPSLQPPTQYHCNCCQHRSSRHPSGWPGYHGDRIDIGGTAHRGHNTDHRCGLVLVSFLWMSSWWGLVRVCSSLNVTVKLQRAQRAHVYKGYWCIMQSDTLQSLQVILYHQCFDSASLWFPVSLASPCRDRLRTTTNVLGDSLGAGIVEHLSRAELQNQDAEVRNSVIEENEKPYQLICQENDSFNHPDSETTIWSQPVFTHQKYFSWGWYHERKKELS